MKKLAIIRKDNAEHTCPYGLPIVEGCQNAGDSVTRMQEISEVKSSLQASTRKSNRRIYVHYKDGTECPYADKISPSTNSVHCDLGEAGEGIKDFGLKPSPFYPRVFSGMGQGGLFSYPTDYYWDNPGARNTFTGIFSIYAKTGEISMTKTAGNPDPILTKLVNELIIKED